MKEIIQQKIEELKGNEEIKEIFHLMINWIDSISCQSIQSNQMNELNQIKEINQPNQMNVTRKEIKEIFTEKEEKEINIEEQLTYEEFRNNKIEVKERFNAFIERNKEKEYCLLCYTSDDHQFGIHHSHSFSFIVNINNSFHSLPFINQSTDQSSEIDEEIEEISLITNQQTNDILCTFGIGTMKLVLGSLGTKQSYSYFFSSLCDLSSDQFTSDELNQLKQLPFFRNLNKFIIEKLILISF